MGIVLYCIQEEKWAAKVGMEFTRVPASGGDIIFI